MIRYILLAAVISLTSCAATELPTHTTSAYQVESPDGFKNIYNPVSDPAVRTAFREIAKSPDTVNYHREKSDQDNLYSWDRQRDELLRNWVAGETVHRAYRAQANNMVRAGCAYYESPRCYTGNTIFDAKCPDDTSVSPAELTSCEEASKQIGDVTGACVIDNKSLKPFYLSGIGDPKRGRIDNQIEDFFKINCVRWQTN